MKTCRVAVIGVITSAIFTMTPALAVEPRAVIELFTSQGCSSCPPADQLLGELAHDPGIIALTLAVDYWDYIGWKDTLALPGHERRQRAYAKMRGERGIYTPQIIVSGAAEAAGSDGSDVKRAIAEATSNATVLSVPVSLTVTDGKISVSAPASKTGSERGEVWLCPVSRAVTVAIGRGENSGRTITYNNVVRRWIKLGDWSGSAATWTFPVKEIQASGADEVVVIVQSGTPTEPGPMLAAAMIPLH